MLWPRLQLLCTRTDDLSPISTLQIRICVKSSAATNSPLGEHVGDDASPPFIIHLLLIICCCLWIQKSLDIYFQACVCKVSLSLAAACTLLENMKVCESCRTRLVNASIVPSRPFITSPPSFSAASTVSSGARRSLTFCSGRREQRIGHGQTDRVHTGRRSR